MELFYKFLGNFFKFLKMMKFKLNLFALLLLFTFNSLPAQKTLNIKEKAVVIVMPSNDRINQLKKEIVQHTHSSIIIKTPDQHPETQTP